MKHDEGDLAKSVQIILNELHGRRQRRSVGGELSGAAHVWKRAAADGGIAAANRIGAADRQTNLDDRGNQGRGVREIALEQSNTQLCVPEAALSSLPESLGWRRIQRADLAGVTGGILVRSRGSKRIIPACIRGWVRSGVGSLRFSTAAVGQA